MSGQYRQGWQGVARPGPGGESLNAVPSLCCSLAKRPRYALDIVSDRAPSPSPRLVATPLEAARCYAGRTNYPEAFAIAGLALVTGASSGIGAAYARYFAERGHGLVLVARRTDRLEALALELKDATGAACEVLVADLSTRQGVAVVVDRISAESSFAAFVHSAGFNTPVDFVANDPNRIDEMVALHVSAATSLTRAILPGMVAANAGSVILMSSLASVLTTKGHVPYSATKSFIDMLVQGLDIELAATGVRVQAVRAGLTRTEFLDSPVYREFNPYERTPSWAFMDADAVVAESMRALEAGKILFVPGWGNRLFLHVMTAPGIRWLLARAIRRAALFSASHED